MYVQAVTQQSESTIVRKYLYNQSSHHGKYELSHTPHLCLAMSCLLRNPWWQVPHTNCAVWVPAFYTLCSSSWHTLLHTHIHTRTHAHTPMQTHTHVNTHYIPTHTHITYICTHTAHIRMHTHRHVSAYLFIDVLWFRCLIRHAYTLILSIVVFLDTYMVAIWKRFPMHIAHTWHNAFMCSSWWLQPSCTYDIRALHTPQT